MYQRWCITYSFKFWFLNFFKKLNRICEKSLLRNDIKSRGHFFPSPIVMSRRLKVQWVLDWLIAPSPILMSKVSEREKIESTVSAWLIDVVHFIVNISSFFLQTFSIFHRPFVIFWSLDSNLKWGVQEEITHFVGAFQIAQGNVIGVGPHAAAVADAFGRPGGLGGAECAPDIKQHEMVAFVGGELLVDLLDFVAFVAGRDGDEGTAGGEDGDDREDLLRAVVRPCPKDRPARNKTNFVRLLFLKKFFFFWQNSLIVYWKRNRRMTGKILDPGESPPWVCPPASIPPRCRHWFPA